MTPAEALVELRERLVTKLPILNEVKRGRSDAEFLRLSGKIEGVKLAVGYLDDLTKIVDAVPLCDQPANITSANLGDLMLQYERIILAFYDQRGNAPQRGALLIDAEDARKLARIVQRREDERD